MVNWKGSGGGCSLGGKGRYSCIDFPLHLTPCPRIFLRPMPVVPENADLLHLIATWRTHPTGTAGAAVAEWYRMQGALVEAGDIAEACLDAWPDSLPARLVLARICRDSGDTDRAAALLGTALGVDASHPVVLGDLAALAETTGHPADARAWRQLVDAATEPTLPDLPAFLAGPTIGMVDEGDGPELADLVLEPGDPGAEVLSESLAALYQAQGHLERAAEVYEALAERDPGHADLAQRRDQLRAELAARRPRPHDARESGGLSVADWLHQLALTGPPSAPGARAAYDDFFLPSTPRRGGTDDLEAFQQWLKELGR